MIQVGHRGTSKRVLQWKNVVTLGVSFALFISASAFAVGLTDSDHEYLATQGVQRGNSVINGLSPKEQSRLHVVINDPAADKDAAVRAKKVRDVLNEFEANQHWEKMNPGQLWDDPRRDNGKRLRD